MKRIIFLLAYVLSAVPAIAADAQKCLALNASNFKCASSELEYGYVDWTTTCTFNGTSIPIKGIGIRSYDGGFGMNPRILDTLPTAGSTATDTEPDSDYCWCKIVEPFVSPWVMTMPNTFQDYYCGSACAHALTYSNLSDFFVTISE